jgi:type VI secretion system secreted protein VgrG
MQDLFTIQSSVLPDDTRVVGFRGTEGLSRPYLFEIFLSIPSDAADFDMADAIGARTTLLVDRGDATIPPYAVHGLLWTLELLLESHGRGIFRAELVPHLTQLTQTLHCRIFTKKTLPEILRETLEDGGLTSDDYELRLDRTYKPEEHVCQYRESHFDFLSRWLEREGLYYFFEQGEDREKLVVTDHKAAHEPLRKGAVRYHPVAGHDGSARESFSSFACRHVSLPATVKLVDYDYLKPTLEVTGSAPVSSTGLGEITEHAARFFSPDDGKRLAKLRAEELLAQRVVYHASGPVLHLRSGYLFDLEDHPRQAFNTRYLVTELTHVGNQGATTAEVRALTGIEGNQVYSVELTAILADVQFRAPRRTPWPRIYGYENGIVDGEADSEYAQIDDHGRYSVKFRFDESELRDGKASTFVRMAQPHGGGVEGWHFPLRKGTEIIFTFLGGDPDRPVIAGVVPNAHTPSPVTRGNHTTNVIQTGGRNRFELEDKSGGQRVTLSTPTKSTMLRMGAPNDDSNLILTTDGNSYHFVGQTWDVWTKGDKYEWVDKTISEEFCGPFRTTVDHDVVETYKENQRTTVTDEREQQFGKLTTHVNKGEWVHHVHGGGESKETYDGPVKILVNATREDTVTGKVEEKFKSGYELKVTGAAEQEATTEWKITAPSVEVTASNGPYKVTALGDRIGLTVALTSETFVGLKNENMIGGKIETLLGIKLEMTYSCRIGIHAGAVFENKAAVECDTAVMALKTYGTQILNAAAAGLEAYGAHMSTAGIHGFL